MSRKDYTGNLSIPQNPSTPGRRSKISGVIGVTNKGTGRVRPADAAAKRPSIQLRSPRKGQRSA